MDPLALANGVELRDVGEVAETADRVVEQFRHSYASLLPGVEIHHIGATAMPFGHTKGDVDVNVRVAAPDFTNVVELFRRTCRIAQPENWTDTFASFACDGYELPLGIQITQVHSENDFLLALRDRMRSDTALLRRYDDCKLSAAPDGADAYWRAKDAFLRPVISSLSDR
jgi:GrpB-like predicted nucleotidyltransferase (UPF0157 family)